MNNVLSTTPDCSPLFPCCFKVLNKANSKLDTSIVYCSIVRLFVPFSSALLISAFIAVLVCLPALFTSCKSNAVLSKALCNLFAKLFKFLSVAFKFKAVNLEFNILVAVVKSSNEAIAILPAIDTKFIDCSYVLPVFITSLTLRENSFTSEFTLLLSDITLFLA